MAVAVGIAQDPASALWEELVLIGQFILTVGSWLLNILDDTFAAGPP